MKIPLSIRNIYTLQKEKNEELSKLVDSRFRALKKQYWHYESRLKTLESLALKFESGRFESVESIDDFFACTLVVRNGLEIDEAIKAVEKHFNICVRRPKSSSLTHKDPDAFPFDDLRLYAHWKDDPALKPTKLSDISFEIQIKTFLQHAWAIATHDLVYKADDIDWSKQRIAYQIKAMLEHAELSIKEADTISKSSLLAKSNAEYTFLNEILAVIKEFWSDDELPANKRGLAQNVYSVISDVGITAGKLKAILEEENSKKRGSHTKNLSPYGIIIQSLLNCELDTFINWLGNKKSKVRVVITQEINLPSKINKDELIRAIFVNK